MLAHQHTRASAPPPTPLRAERAAKRSTRAARIPDRQRGSGPAAMTDRERAERYIAAKRECGLLVFPYPGPGNKIYLAECGLDDAGAFSYGAGTKRFLSRPEIWWDFPEGLLGEVLCADFGVDPADPELHAKVDARILVLRAEHDVRVGRTA